MKLPGRLRTGLRALFDLAFHGSGRQAQVKDIARRQHIPVRYLEEVMQELRKAKLVEAQRGPRGGYALARPADTISVADVFAALAGQAAGLDDSRDCTGSMDGAGIDIPSLMCDELAARITITLAQTTLADFIARAESAGVRRAPGQPPMYFI
jgi:Rrf2 family iron-sulfur cluster assembly transcriptional regulator